MSKPKIRFNGFTEDWEQRKVLEFAESVSPEAGTMTSLP